MKKNITVQVENPNLKYAQTLLQDYAGIVSELTAITLYSYQQIIKSKKEPQYAKILE